MSRHSRRSLSFVLGEMRAAVQSERRARNGLCEAEVSPVAVSGVVVDVECAMLCHGQSDIVDEVVDLAGGGGGGVVVVGVVDELAHGRAGGEARLGGET